VEFQQPMTDDLYKIRALVAVYDVLNGSREDFDFYFKQLPHPPGRILDVGCGTGAFALRLAAAGYSVTAVDPAAEMIGAARRKPRAEDVDWIVGHAEDAPIGTAFDATVMTGHAFQCLLTDEEIRALFGAVADRLSPNGSFWFETRNPNAQAWARWAPENAQPALQLDAGRSVQVIRNVLAVKGEFVTFSENYVFDGGRQEMTSQSTLRFLDRGRIEQLALRSGLKIKELYGDWNGGRLDENSPEIIFRLVPKVC